MVFMTKGSFICFGVVAMVTVALCTESKKHGPDENEMSLQEKAQYHFGELRNTLMEMNAFQNNGFGNLLGILIPGGSKSNQADLASSAVLRSILSFCHSVHNAGEGSSTNINIFNNSTVYFSMKAKKAKDKKADRKEEKAKQTKGKEKESSASSSETSSESSLESSPQFHVLSDSHSPSWMDTGACPFHVDAKRQGHLVTLTFNVSRSNSAYASHTFTYEGQRKELKGPQEYGLDAHSLISSTVDFTINASMCGNLTTSLDTRRREHFFFSENNVNSCDIAATINPCFFLHDKKAKNKTEFSQNILYPNFCQQINVSTINTLPGENYTIELEVSMDRSDHLAVSGFFYDSATEKVNLSGFIIVSAFDGQMAVNLYSDDKGIDIPLSVEYENVEQINETLPWKMTTKDWANRKTTYTTGTVKITVARPRDDVSGYLYLRQYLNFQDAPGILDLMQTMKRVEVKAPNQRHAIPEGKYFVTSDTSFFCGPDKQSYHDRGYGNDCIVICQTFGRGIKNVRVRKLDGDVDIVQKYKEVLDDKAYLFANLGPARKEVDGVYECKAVSHRAKPHKWRVTLRSWGFPRVTNHSLTVTNESAIFTCAGSGSRQPLEVTVLIDDGAEPTRIDDDPRFTRRVSQNGNETALQLTMPIGYLKYPRSSLTCRVKNIAETVNEYQHISKHNVPDFYAGTDHPSIVASQFYITDHFNGSATIQCTATGKQPMALEGYFDYESDDNLIRVDNMTSRTDDVEGNEMKTRITLPLTSLKWPRSWIRCRAENSLGSDGMSFNLFDYHSSYDGR